ncbi:protein SUPPRESSOR OF MAX2 1-like [Diospyros lotus]|uniref:protein SUPPRESSOR OF MAX2 1-like n=1 Tax=Diospyros lotus TaxID=55363 RepID=UPI002250857A|nr:protein SUPPRESSOR OF MAX2 1-like [Diospyros lotus]
MREASFSSPAVKATIEQSLNSQPQNINPAPVGLGFRPNPVPIPSRNLYLNPRLQQGNSAQSGQQRNEEVIKIRDVLLRSKKKNPILVGESEPEAVIRELLRRIEKGEFGEGPLKSAQVIPIEKEITLDKTQIPTRIKELGALIETRMGNSSGGGIILDLGDLKWLVEQQQPAGLGVPCSGAVHQQVEYEAGRAAVAEMAKLVVRFGDSGRLWLIGTATCETYLRCQVYHPTMENDWDLQAVPIASRSPLPGMFRRPGPHGILSSSVESLSPLKGFPNVTAALSRRASENSDPARRMSCCPQCTDSYEKELAKLVANVYEKSSSEVGSEVVAQSALPLWLQNAKALSGDTKTVDQSQTKDQEMVFKQKSQELQEKWADTCLQLHPNFHNNLGSERVGPASVSMTGLYNPKLLVRQPLQQKLQQMKTLGEALQLNSNPAANQPSERAGSPPRSPVRTDLVLGPTKVSDNTAEKPHKDDVTDKIETKIVSKI